MSNLASQANPVVLTIDDDVAVLTVLEALLEQQGIRVITANSALDGLTVLERGGADISAIIVDLRMPDMDGMSLLEAIGRRHPGIPVVMLTAHGSVPLAVEAMKRGAADFVLKPFDREELLFTIRKVLAQRGAPGGCAHSAAACPLVGDSAPMRQLREMIGRVAPGGSTVLLRGETGTGKELAARALHNQSQHADGPFVRVHCAALPDNLLESELFGHEQGAFTGAVRRKPGRVELAQGGTLFLDEIGDVTPAVQVKLLQLLQEREFNRLGGTHTLRADARFVAATHRDLEGMVAAGEFREDLFYRLNVVPVWLPPLRARPGDVVVLARRFADEVARTQNKMVSFDPAALELLASERWPGNVRQLKNFVERLVVLAETSKILRADVEYELARLPSFGDNQAELPPSPLEAQRRQAEKHAVETALRQSRGNRSQAARILGISRRTLYKELRQQGIA
jgi:two-component system response regulator AtoC